MRSRLGFSIAVHVDPAILLIDEVIGAGDERFRQRVGRIFDQFTGNHKTIVFVTHSVEQLQAYCTRALWLEEGRVRADGPPKQIAASYLEASKAKPKEGIAQEYE